MSADADQQEMAACTPTPVSRESFNPDVELPFACRSEDIFNAMSDFAHFLGLVNGQLQAHSMPRLESLLMPANFSSIVSEYMTVTIPKYCAGLVKNLYHNGHPDLIPTGRFPGNAIQYSHEGIEIKASRYSHAWQGHNVEASWLMVFVFDSNRPSDGAKGIASRPFRFVKVVGAQLDESDWKFSGRAEASRRTITASVLPSGYQKMEANWIYREPRYSESQADESDEDESEPGSPTMLQ